MQLSSILFSVDYLVLEFQVSGTGVSHNYDCLCLYHSENGGSVLIKALGHDDTGYTDTGCEGLGESRAVTGT